MNESECWTHISSLISEGRRDDAIEQCRTHPYSQTLKCQRYLGWEYYTSGKLDEAFLWFGRSASNDDGESLFGLACTYFVSRKFTQSLECYNRAAENNFTRAYNWIGYIYHQGLGMPSDLNKAKIFYKKGAESGYLISERALIHLSLKSDPVIKKLISIFKLSLIVVKAGVIAYRDINDRRIIDIQEFDFTKLKWSRKK